MGDRLDKAALCGFVGQFAPSPLRDGPPALFGRLTREGHNLRDLLRGELGGFAPARGIVEHLHDPRFERLVGLIFDFA